MDLQWHKEGTCNLLYLTPKTCCYLSGIEPCSPQLTPAKQDGIEKSTLTITQTADRKTRGGRHWHLTASHDQGSMQ